MILDENKIDILENLILDINSNSELFGLKL